MTLRAESGRRSPWRHVTPGTGSGGSHPGDCGHVTSGAGSGRGHPGDCGHVSPGTGSHVQTPHV